MRAQPHNRRQKSHASTAKTRNDAKGGESVLIIENGTVFSMCQDPIPDGCVLIDQGKILRVGTRCTPAERAGATILDAGGGWILPGLIEAHCHVGISEEKTGLQGDDCNETTDPLTPYLRAIDAINPMDAAFHNAVRAGITGAMIGPGSSNVVGGQFAFLKTDGRSVDEMVVLAPAAMKVAFGENPKTNYSGQSKMPATRMSIAGMLREELFAARTYQAQKEAAAESGADFTEDFRKECWLPVLRREIPLKAHVHRADDILTAIRIAREFDLRLTLDHCTEGHLIAPLVKASGFPAIVGPSIASRNKVEVQYADFKTPGVLADAGVTVAITTDHPVSLLQHLPICAGLAAREGLGVERALRAITCDAAAICGVDDRLGTLAPGKDADVAVFTGNPMEVFTKTLYTLIGGEVLYDHRHPQD